MKPSAALLVVVLVVGWQCTVVVWGLFGIQGGSVVVGPGVVGPPMVVLGEAAVVLVPGLMVVVDDGAPPHPKAASSETKTPETDGNPAKATCSERTNWQMVARKDSPIWAAATPSDAATMDGGSAIMRSAT